MILSQTLGAAWCTDTVLADIVFAILTAATGLYGSPGSAVWLTGYDVLTAATALLAWRACTIVASVVCTVLIASTSGYPIPFQASSVAFFDRISIAS